MKTKLTIANDFYQQSFFKSYLVIINRNEKVCTVMVSNYTKVIWPYLLISSYNLFKTSFRLTLKIMWKLITHHFTEIIKYLSYKLIQTQNFLIIFKFIPSVKEYMFLSQPNSTSSQGWDWQINGLAHPPQTLLRHFQATQEAAFRYATLFWPN